MPGFSTGFGAGQSNQLQEGVQQRLVQQERDRAEERYNKQQEEARRREEANKDAGIAQSIGKIGGSILGGVGGALLAPVTGGASIPMGAMLGSSLGSGLGGGVAGMIAPGSQGQYAMQGAEGLTAGINPVMQYLMAQESKGPDFAGGYKDPGSQGLNYQDLNNQWNTQSRAGIGLPAASPYKPF